MDIFFLKNKVKSLFALLVWSLTYFVILLHSCSFLHKLEMVAPEVAESQEKQDYFQYCRQGFTTCLKGASQTVSYPGWTRELLRSSHLGLKPKSRRWSFVVEAQPVPTCCPCFVHSTGVIHSLSWGKESVSLWLTPAWVSLMWFPLIWRPASHTAPCQSLCHSPGTSLCPASPASFKALVGWEGDFQFPFSFGN